jgi:hypothetical protein
MKQRLKEQYKRINGTKYWLFEKINKIDKPLAKLIKRRENNLINRAKRGTIITDTNEVHRITRKYF